MTTLVYADVEGAVRDWLKDASEIAALVDGRVFFAIPEPTNWPLIVVHQVSGGPDAGEAPISNSLIQIDCWSGPTKTGKANKAEATEVMNAVVGAVQSLTCGTSMGTAGVALGARIQNVSWLPDPDTNQARYVVDALFCVRAP